jgi:hypothetical protein
MASLLVNNEICIDILLDAGTRKDLLRRLIRLANSLGEWDGLGRLFKRWKRNQWGMEPVAETAIYGMLICKTLDSLVAMKLLRVMTMVY